MKSKVKRKLFPVLLLAFLLLLPSLPAVEAGQKDFRQRGERMVLVTGDDVVAEIEFGKVLAAKVLGKYGLYQNQKLTQYVNLVGKGIARYSSRPELEFRFAILDTDLINAFAAPGGYIFVSRGSLEKMENEAELAGVLSHEIAHVTERHIVKQLKIRAADTSAVSSFAVVVKAMAGGGSLEVAFLELADRAASILFEDGLKREDEYQSDKVGTLLAAQVGYDPGALKEYLQRVASGGKNEKLLGKYHKTHPPFEKRIAGIATLMKENGLEGGVGKRLEDRFQKNGKPEI